MDVPKLKQGFRVLTFLRETSACAILRERNDTNKFSLMLQKYQWLKRKE